MTFVPASPATIDQLTRAVRRVELACDVPTAAVFLASPIACLPGAVAGAAVMEDRVRMWVRDTALECGDSVESACAAALAAAHSARVDGDMFLNPDADPSSWFKLIQSGTRRRVLGPSVLWGLPRLHAEVGVALSQIATWVHLARTGAEVMPPALVAAGTPFFVDTDGAEVVLRPSRPVDSVEGGRGFVPDPDRHQTGDLSGAGENSPPGAPVEATRGATSETTGEPTTDPANDPGNDPSTDPGTGPRSGGGSVSDSGAPLGHGRLLRVATAVGEAVDSVAVNAAPDPAGGVQGAVRVTVRAWVPGVAGTRLLSLRVVLTDDGWQWRDRVPSSQLGSAPIPHLGASPSQPEERRNLSRDAHAPDGPRDADAADGEEPAPGVEERLLEELDPGRWRIRTDWSPARRPRRGDAIDRARVWLPGSGHTWIHATSGVIAHELR